MSDILIDNSENVFKIDKDVLLFRINSNRLKDFVSHSSGHPVAISETELFVTNLTSEYLAFRTKTTKKQNYAVNPTYCVLAPGVTQKIEIAFYTSQGEKVDEKGHKFKFEGFIISQSKNNSNPKDIFSEYIQRREQVKGQTEKLLVKYIEDNNYYCNVSKSSLNLLKRAVDENNILAESIYSVANPVEKTSKSVLRTGKRYNEETEKDMFERLKNENQKLKDQMDNLNSNCSNLKSRIESEKSSSSQTKSTSTKFFYKVPELKQKSISNIVLIAALIGSILLGFFLVK